MTSPFRAFQLSHSVVRGSMLSRTAGLRKFPFRWPFSERYFIQMDPDLAEPRASIWGMDNASTQIAVSVFVDRFLPRFLDRCTIVPAHLSSFDSDGESGAGYRYR